MSAAVTNAPSSERYFVLGLRVIAVFAIVTGLVDVIVGTGILPSLGSALTAEAGSDPGLDSQFRFLSAMWLGYGLALYWVSNAIAARLPLLNILALAMFVGGVGRLVSIGVNGAPPPAMFAFLVIELIGPVVAVLLGRRLKP